MTAQVWLLWKGRAEPHRDGTIPAPVLVGAYADRVTLREDALAIRRYDRRARLVSTCETVKGGEA